MNSTKTGPKLTHAADDAKPARMGRKPLNVKEIKIRLTEEQRARIEALVGTYGIARWIREAVDEKLERSENGHSRPDGR